MKFAYCTTITKDDYIPCIILNKRLLDYFNSKYPFVVLVGNEVSQKGIEWLKEFNIIVKEVPTFQMNPLNNLKNSYYVYVAMHFSSLSLIEYDYVLSFEADILFLENPDFYFNYYKEIKEHHNFYFESLKEKKYNHKHNDVFKEQNTICYLCKPNLTVYNELKKYANLDVIKDDHSIIRIFYYNKSLQNQKLNYIHLIGQPKIWISFKDSLIIQKIFYNTKNNIEEIYNFLKNASLHKDFLTTIIDDYAQFRNKIKTFDDLLKINHNF